VAAIAARTKSQYDEEGENSTRYFVFTGKPTKTIEILMKDNFDTITETHTFYKYLYTAQQTEPHKQTEFLNITTPRVTQQDRDHCESHITEHELQTVLKTMENHKSPRLDGLCTNFYKHFWPILRHDLTYVYYYAFDHRQLPLTQLRGVISLLFKKGNHT